MEDFNFFSPYIEERYASKSRFLIIGLILILFSSLIIGFHILTNSTIRELNNNIEDMEKQLNSEDIKEQLNEIENIKEKKEIMTNYYIITKELDSRVNKFDKINVRVLNKIFNSFFSEVHLENIYLSTSEVQMEGKANTRYDVAQLVHNLNNTNLFAKVHVYDITLEDGETDIYGFSIECYFKDGINHEVN